MTKRKPIRERLSSGVEVKDDCWIWIKCRNDRGYGQIWVDRKLEYAHRVSYEEYVGPIPEGLNLDHLCRVPPCINPKHLEPVTHKENCKRGLGGKYQSARTHCPQGHTYDKENTYWYKNRRNCRECRRIKGRQRYHEKKGAR